MNKYNDRRSSFLRKKRIQNLPKFDLANKTIDSGRLTTNYGVDTSGFWSTDNADLSSLISVTNNSALTGGIQKGLSYGTSVIGNIINNSAVTDASRRAAIRLAEKGAMKAGLPFTIGMEDAAAAGANTVASTIGTAMNVAGAAYGGYNTVKDFSNYNRTFGGDTLMDMSGRTQLSVNGVNYTTYNGLNTDLIKKLTSATNKVNTVNTTLDAAGTGASIGGIVGTIVPGIGNVVGSAVGGVIGAVGGLVGGLFGARHRRRKQERETNRILGVMDGYNTQAEAEAASQGLRNLFNATHSYFGADGGKDEYGSVGGATGYGKVWTPAGQEYGQVNSMVGKGESIIDYTRGEASYVDKGTKRVDNQPSIAADGDLIVIAGNKVDPTTGVPYADQVAPMSKEVQKLNKIIKNADPNTITGKLQIELANIAKDLHLQNMKEITDRQQLHNMYDNAGMHYDSGKNNWANAIGMISPYAAMMAAPIEELSHYKGHTLRAENPYVANRNANAALLTLSQIGYDPRRALLAINDNSRMANYAINQSGAYSPGLRMAMLTANNTNRQKAISQEYANAAQMNNQYKSAYAQALMQAGEADRQAAQQALSTQQERRRQAYAQKRKGIESAHQGMINIGTSALKNYYSQLQYNAAREDQQKMLDLYGQQIDIDRYRAMHPNGETTTTTPRAIWTPSFKYTPITAESIMPNKPTRLNDYALGDYLLTQPTLNFGGFRYRVPNYKFTI